MRKLPPITCANAGVVLTKLARSPNPAKRVDKAFVILFSLCLHPRAVKVARHRPVYWLASQRPFRLPGAMAPVASCEGQLRCSCGAAAALELSFFTAFPSCVPLVAGTDDARNYRLEFRRRKPDPPEGRLR